MSRTKRLSRRYIARKYSNSNRRLRGLQNHPFLIPITIFLLMFFASSVALVALNGQTIGASDSRVVHVSVDGEVQTVPTRAETVKVLLERLGIAIQPEDFVEPTVETKILEDDLKITVQRARPVTVVDGEHKVTVLSARQQPRLIAQDAGITLHAEDGIRSGEVVGPVQDMVIGEKVVIDRAIEANINLYGNDIAVRTRAKTVADLLSEKQIKTLQGDTIQPSPNTLVVSGTKVLIVRVGRQIKTEETTIEPPVATVDDPALAVGASVVKEPGSPGKKIITYEIELKNDKEIGRKVLQDVISVQPVRRVVSKGTKVVLTGGKAEWLVAAGVTSAEEQTAADFIIGRESGWCPTKWQGEYGGCPAYHGAPSSGGVGYGLCQATPGYKMASAGADWGVNPVTQLKWCTGYANSRYGSWQAAYRFWVVNHWW